MKNIFHHVFHLERKQLNLNGNYWIHLYLCSWLKLQDASKKFHQDHSYVILYAT
jgi:hypothetical protein